MKYSRYLYYIPRRCPRLSRGFAFIFWGLLFLLSAALFFPTSKKNTFEIFRNHGNSTGAAASGFSRKSLSKCYRNPWVRMFSDAEFERDEQQSYIDSLNMFSQFKRRLDRMATGPPIVTDSNRMYEGVPSVVEERDFGRFDIWPVSGSCPSGLTRIGGTDDGGKFLCAVEKLEDSDDCVVFSLGSAGKYEFEQGIFETTKSCITHTFDCTVDAPPPPQIRGRTIFHHICIGDPEGRSNFRSLQSLQAEFAPNGISLLKMDIEGFEWDVFTSLLWADTNAYPVGREYDALPHQMSFELHWWTIAGRRDYTHGDVALLFKSLYDAGYRLLSREDNHGSPDGCCAEFTILRYLC